VLLGVARSGSALGFFAGPLLFLFWGALFFSFLCLFIVRVVFRFIEGGAFTAVHARVCLFFSSVTEASVRRGFFVVLISRAFVSRGVRFLLSLVLSFFFFSLHLPLVLFFCVCFDDGVVGLCVSVPVSSYSRTVTEFLNPHLCYVCQDASHETSFV